MLGHITGWLLKAIVSLCVKTVTMLFDRGQVHPGSFTNRMLTLAGIEIASSWNLEFGCEEAMAARTQMISICLKLKLPTFPGAPEW